MPPELAAYFAAEKNEGLLFVAFGVAAVAASAWMWKTGSAHRAMGYPLVGVALIQLVVGASVFLRTDGQVAALGAERARAPEAFKTAELARMEAVERNFKIYKAIELALFVAGVLLTYAFRRRELVYGVGVGLVMQASLMLVLDLFAERRAELYVRLLQR